MSSIGCRKISLQGRNKQVLIYNEEIQWESPGRCLTTVGILLSYEETYKMFEDFVLLKSSSIYALRHFFS